MRYPRSFELLILYSDTSLRDKLIFNALILPVVLEWWQSGWVSGPGFPLERVCPAVSQRSLSTAVHWAGCFGGWGLNPWFFHWNIIKYICSNVSDWMMWSPVKKAGWPWPFLGYINMLEQCQDRVRCKEILENIHILNFIYSQTSLSRSRWDDLKNFEISEYMRYHG